MKRAIIIIVILTMIFACFSACEQNNDQDKTASQTKITTDSSDTGSDSDSSTEQTDQSGSSQQQDNVDGEFEQMPVLNYDATTVEEFEIKSYTQTAINEIYEQLIDKVPAEYRDIVTVAKTAVQLKVAIATGSAEELKGELTYYYNKLISITRSLSEINEDFEKAKTGIVSAIEDLGAIYEKQNNLGNIDNLKAQLNTIKGKISAISDVNNLPEVKERLAAEIKNCVEEFVNSKIDEKLGLIKTSALEKVDQIVDEFINKLDDDFADKLNVFRLSEKQKISDIDDIEKIYPEIETVFEDTKQYVLKAIKDKIAELKANAIEELDGAVLALTERITDEDLRNDVNDFYIAEKTIIENVGNVDGANAAFGNVKTDTAEFVKNIAARQLEKTKTAAKAELDEKIGALIDKIPEGDIKVQTQGFYANESALILAINDLDGAKITVEQIKTDTAEFINSVSASLLAGMKTKAIQELDGAVYSLTEKITDVELKNEINEFYVAEKAVIENIENFDEINTAIDKVKADTTEFVKKVVARQLEKIKAAAKAELDEKVGDLIEKIPDGDIKTQTQNFYAKESALIVAIDDLDGAKTTVEQIKTDTAEFINSVSASLLAEMKTKAIQELDLIVNSALNKLKSQDLKTELNNYYNTEKAKIQAIDDIDEAESALSEISGDTREFALKLVASQTAALRAKVKEYLDVLTGTLEFSPYSYIPETMRPDYSGNIVSAGSVDYDYSNNVSVSSVNFGGFGEQWHMVVDNIEKSQSIYTYLNKGDAIISLSVTLLNEYLDSEYSDGANTSIENEKLNVSISFDDGILRYELRFISGINIPLFGEVTPAVEMVYDTLNNEKTIRIAVNENSAVKYVVKPDSYSIGISLSLSAYTRTSYLSLTRDGSAVEGHIYEYHTIKGKDAVKACADIYIGSQYVSVVGNKASGIIGFTGYINELYDVSAGKLLGYEIRETLSILGISGTYNTLWFNLKDIEGVDSVRLVEKDKYNQNENPHYVYINGGSSVFEPTYNMKLLKKTSRKYDIELRKRYFYSLENDGELIEHEVLIPMMFIQEGDNYSTYTSDVKKNNDINSSVTIEEKYLNKILDDYDNLIDVFIENKDTIDSNYITDFVKA